MSPIEHSYWQDTVPSETRPDLPIPERTDVAIIGGGITGLCAARGLARRGERVAVLEANTIGWGASSRNGGMVLTGLKLGGRTLIERYGRDLARELFKASVDSVTCVEQIVAEEHISCHFRRSGHLSLASKPEHMSAYAQSAEFLQKEFGHRVHLVPRSELREEIGSDYYYGGVIDGLSGGINPAQYVAGVARAAEAAGATLCENARVLRMEREGADWRLHTARGVTIAGEILVATSGYTGEITPALRKKLLPIGSYVIATEPLTEAVARSLSPLNRMMYDSRHFLFYFRLTPDRRLLFGGRARFVPETETTVRESVAVLREGMLAVYPQLQDVRIDYVWGGTLDFAYDTMPHVGQVEGCHFALGYAGHGVALASYLGTRMADAMLAGTVEQLPFARIPFPGAPLGLHWGKSGFLRLAAAWYKFLDWAA